MTHLLALALTATFLLIAAWHVWMALHPAHGPSATVPSVDGKPLFVPSRNATLAVAVVLLLFAALIASTAGLVPPPIPRRVLGWLCYALALGLAARAVGEFRYVGFFKRVRGSTFARLDSLVYSPLCLVLAIGVAVVARSSTPW